MNLKLRLRLVIIIVVCLIGLTAKGAAFGPNALSVRLEKLVGPMDAVVVTGPDGAELAAINADNLLVPASILKVLTSLAALHYLGPAYRFPTDFYLDGDQNLTIKGYGDPMLVSERLSEIAGELAGRVHEIRNLVLDDRYFVTPIRIPGRGRSNEPYDAPNGALCVNFNTVFFKRKNGQWVSAEEQTPLLPSVIPKIRAAGLASGRITLAGSTEEGIHYAGELFDYFFIKAGIRVQGRIIRATGDPEPDTLLWRHRSPDQLTAVIANLLEFSNNFIANQLMLAMGAKAYGPPATVDNGVKALRHYYHEVLGISKGRIVEASGISRQNRISARIMLRLLNQFREHHLLLRHQGRHWYKTGHLKGIRTQAGYYLGKGDQLYTYAVIINTPGKTTHRILQEIEKALNSIN